MSNRNSEKNSGKQRREQNLIVHRFKPGQSGNPRGRPPTRGLLNALKAELAAVGKDGRTVEQQLAAQLVREALRGRNKRAAIAEIFDRLEGRPKQHLDVNDITKQMEGRSSKELIAFAETGRWPEEEEKNG